MNQPLNSKDIDNGMPPLDLSPYIADAIAWGASNRNPALLRPVLLDDVIKAGIDEHPRSQQREIGPSQLGHPCNRWLAHFFAGTEPTDIQPPNWAAALGTAGHAVFGDWCQGYNERHGVARFLTDLKVAVGELYPGRPVRGTLDVLDTWTATVIDLKICGPTQMRKHGPGKPESPVYEIQGDSYGNGCVNAGYPVASVGILRLPRHPADLSGATLNVWPHNPQRAHSALVRAGGVARMVDVLGKDAIPLQPTVEHYCASCSFYLPDAVDLTQACPGADSFREARERRVDAAKAACESLIA